MAGKKSPRYGVEFKKTIVNLHQNGNCCHWMTIKEQFVYLSAHFRFFGNDYRFSILTIALTEPAFVAVSNLFLPHCHLYSKRDVFVDEFRFCLSEWAVQGNHEYRCHSQCIDIFLFEYNAITPIFTVALSMNWRAWFYTQKESSETTYFRGFYFGACDRIRTCDLLITNELHYQLCYTSVNIKF